ARHRHDRRRVRVTAETLFVSLIRGDHGEAAQAVTHRVFHWYGKERDRGRSTGPFSALPVESSHVSRLADATRHLNEHAVKKREERGIDANAYSERHDNRPGECGAPPC